MFSESEPSCLGHSDLSAPGRSFFRRVEWQSLQKVPSSLSPGFGWLNTRADVPTWQRIDREIALPRVTHVEMYDSESNLSESSAHDVMQNAETGDFMQNAETGDFSALDVRDRVVIMLLFKQIVRMEEVEAAWHRWQNRQIGRAHEPLWRVLARDPAFDRHRILAEAALSAGHEQLQVPLRDAASFIENHAQLFSESQWKRLLELRLMPVARPDQGRDAGRIIFATPDPTHPQVNRLLREIRAGDYRLRYISEPDFDQIIADISGASSSDGDADPTGSLSRCLADAVKNGASDIHFLPDHGSTRIEMRIDGSLEPWQDPAHHPVEDIIGLIKARAQNIDPSESDVPQHGILSERIDGVPTRFRVSILPVVADELDGRAESAVVRLESKEATGADLQALRFSDSVISAIDRAIHEAKGMIVLAGPPDTGRETALEAILSERSLSRQSVIALENSVEHALPGIRRIRLNQNFCLEEALESIRSHDADILVVGELRTRDAAELALRLANTDHLVLATMPSHDTAGAVRRILTMGIEPVLAAYAVNLVIAQRVVRRLCPDCKTPSRHVDGEMLRRLGFSPHDIASTTFYGEGEVPDCLTCAGTGYHGVRIIAEAMTFSPAIRREIALADADFHGDDLRERAVREGMSTLRASAREVVKQEETSISELIRATAGDQ